MLRDRGATRDVVIDQAKQSLMTECFRGGTRVDLWIEGGKHVRDQLLENGETKLNTKPNKGYGGAHLHHVVLESWNKDKLRWICRSGHSSQHQDLRMVASVVIDEAHLPNVMTSVMIIDLLSEDPRLGGKSPCE